VAKATTPPSVGVFDGHAAARSAIEALQAAGVPRRAISVLASAQAEAHALGRETGAAEDLERLIQDRPLADLLSWLGRIEGFIVPGYGAVLGTGNLGLDLARPDAKRGSVTGLLVGVGISVDEAANLEQAVFDGKILVVAHGTYPLEAARSALASSSTSPPPSPP
jgi:hypothetical protein